MTSTKDTAIEDQENYKKSALEAIGKLERLITALKKHDGKLIDQRFFNTHFKISNEYRDYTEFSLAKPVYNFDRYAYRVYLNNNYHLELDNRERDHVLQSAIKMSRELQDRILGYEDKIKSLSGLDEEAIVSDLIAVYKKHGKPDIWRKILEKYEVIYPNEK